MFDYNPNRASIPVRVLWIVDHVVRLILESVAGVVNNMAGQMPTNKRKMNRKQSGQIKKI